MTYLGTPGQSEPELRFASMHPNATWNLSTWSFIPEGASTRDNVFRLAWNAAPGGGPLVADEPYWGFSLEQDFESGGKHFSELNIEFALPG